MVVEWQGWFVQVEVLIYDAILMTSPLKLGAESRDFPREVVRLMYRSEDR